MSQKILLEKKEGIATIIINRPEVRNALNEEALQEFFVHLKDVREDKKTKALVVTGAGDKAFCAGQDLKMVSRFTEEYIKRHGGYGWKPVMDSIWELDIPTVAAINGFAVGAGFQMTLYFDMRIASENAKLGLPEINQGIPCIMGGFLTKHFLPLGKAMELVLTGDLWDAREAEKFGLVNKVVPPDELLSSAREMAKKLASKSPLAYKLTKHNMKFDKEAYEAARKRTGEVQTQAIRAGDIDKGIKAFFGKKTRTN